MDNPSSSSPVPSKGIETDQATLQREAYVKLVNEAVDDAVQDGSNWVLKPQREGGGNNMYGSQLSTYLDAHRSSPMIAEYVLMKRIFPKIQKSAFLRNGELTVLPSVSELGIYGR